MSEPLVDYAPQPPATVITLNRPEHRNALNGELVAALTEAFHRAGADDSRCVILTGAGAAFCAGMDLVELHQTRRQPAATERVGANAHRLAALFQLIRTFPKPTIAAVNGVAVAGGAGLVSVCDLAVATAEARLGYPGVRRGLAAAVVIPPLLRHVGERVARYLLLTGELIGAAEAQRVGLIDKVVPSADQLLEQSLAWARSLAEGCPNALMMTKARLERNYCPGSSVDEVSKADTQLWCSEEAGEGLESFVAKRPPGWV